MHVVMWLVIEKIKYIMVSLGKIFKIETYKEEVIIRLSYK